jgi:hypothetical protein
MAKAISGTASVEAGPGVAWRAMGLDAVAAAAAIVYNGAYARGGQPGTHGAVHISVAVLTYGLLVPASLRAVHARSLSGRRRPGAEPGRPHRAAGVVLGRPGEDHGVRDNDHSDWVVGRRSLQWTSWSYTALPAGQSAIGRVSSTETTSP